MTFSSAPRSVSGSSSSSLKEETLTATRCGVSFASSSSGSVVLMSDVSRRSRNSSSISCFASPSVV